MGAAGTLRRQLPQSRALAASLTCAPLRPGASPILSALCIRICEWRGSLDLQKDVDLK